MSQSLTNFDAALKETYGPGLRNAINNSSVILSEVERRADRSDFQGREAVWAVHSASSSATGARAENGTLPTAGNQAYDDARQKVKYLYHTIKVSGPVMAASRTDAGSFARALESEMKGAEKDLKRNVQRQLFGRFSVQTATATVGRTGAMATCGTTGGSDLVVLATATTLAQMRYFFVGQVIDIIDSTDGTTLASARSITAIDVPNRKITISGAGVTTTSDHIVVVSGSYDAEFPGLRALVNDNAGDKVNGTDAVLVHGISSTTVPAWASVKVGSSTTPISEDLLEQAFDKVETDGAGEPGDLIIGSYEQRRKLAGTLQAQKRYEGREMTLTSGWRGLNVSRGSYVADRYCPDNDAFLVKPSELGWFVLEDFDWDEDDGRVLNKALDGSDAVEARFKAYVSLAALTRNSHCRIAFQAV